jgi:hypothetical protein
MKGCADMQVSENRQRYWQKNLQDHGDPAGHLVRGDLRRRVLRPRSELQFLRLAVQLLHGCARARWLVYVVIIWLLRPAT